MTPLMESGCSFDFSFCLTLFFTYSVIPNTCSYFKCIETSFAKLPDWKASLQRCRSPWSWYQPPPEHHGWLWLTSLTHSRVLSVFSPDALQHTETLPLGQMWNHWRQEGQGQAQLSQQHVVQCGGLVQGWKGKAMSSGLSEGSYHK